MSPDENVPPRPISLHLRDQPNRHEPFQPLLFPLLPWEDAVTLTQVIPEYSIILLGLDNAGKNRPSLPDLSPLHAALRRRCRALVHSQQQDAHCRPECRDDLLAGYVSQDLGRGGQISV